MKKILSAAKALLLVTALAILAWSATIVPSNASADTWCASPGKTCEITSGGTTHHMKEFEAY